MLDRLDVKIMLINSQSKVMFFLAGSTAGSLAGSGESYRLERNLPELRGSFQIYILVQPVQIFEAN